MDIKYTNDNKKVRIVGKLNNQETIVQEIFIVNGNEIPSGENFVVKSLHDTPVKSWKEKNLEELEARYDIKREDLFDSERKLEEKIRNTQRTISASGALERYFSIEKLKHLDLFLSGGITHYVESGYSSIKIVEFVKANCSYNKNNMKLLTLYGESGGELNWKLGTYSDGSGGSCEVIPCVSYEEAITKAQEVLDGYILKDGKVNSDLINSAKKYNLIIPKKYIKNYYKETIKIKEKLIKFVNKNIDKYKTEIINLNKQLNNL